MNFLYWHMQDTMVILEEGNLPHPWCLAVISRCCGRPYTAAPQHFPIQQGGIVEAPQDGSGGDVGEHRTVFIGIWPPTYLVVIIQVH